VNGVFPEPQFPVFQVPGTPFQVSPSALADRPLLALRQKSPVHLPGESPSPCGAVSYPSRGAFRCRSIGAPCERRTLTRPVRPLQTLVSASYQLGFRFALCDISLGSTPIAGHRPL
jgi:hypothetical protein